MKCPKCGNEIADDSNFCEFCGTQILKVNSKLVDIRWCLLLVMISVTYPIFMVWNQFEFTNSQMSDLILPIVVLIVLFLIIIWCRIKRIVTQSFVLIMSVLLLLNCAFLYDIGQAEEILDLRSTAKLCVNGSAYDIIVDEREGIRQSDYYRLKENMLEIMQERLKEFNEKGLRVIGESAVYGLNWRNLNEYKDASNFALVFAPVCLIIYFIYAHKSHIKRGGSKLLKL